MTSSSSGSQGFLRIRTSEPDPFHLVEGVRVSGWSLSQEGVDVTNAGDGAWRRLIAGAGMRKLEVSLNGVCLASPGEVILRRNAFTGAAFEAELTLENETVILGPFIATELSSDSAVSEEATFAAKLLSAGPISLV